MKIKKILLLMFCLLFLFTLTSCGSTKPNDNIEQNKPIDTIVFKDNTGKDITLKLEVTKDPTKSLQALEYALTPDYYTMSLEADASLTSKSYAFVETTDNKRVEDTTIKTSFTLQKDPLNYLAIKVNAKEILLMEDHGIKEKYDLDYKFNNYFDSSSKYLYKHVVQSGILNDTTPYGPDEYKNKTDMSKKFEYINSLFTSKDFNLYLEAKKYVESAEITNVSDKDYTLNVKLVKTLIVDFNFNVNGDFSVNVTVDSKTGRITKIVLNKLSLIEIGNDPAIKHEWKKIFEGELNLTYPDKVNITKLTPEQMAQYK